LVGLGFTPLGSDTVVDATVVQADHAEYRAIDESMRGRLGLLVDGRDMGIDADITIGAPTA
ncbi:MAG: nucleotide sugar dehydrogenase, partial [Ilumatobacteraceae bacterium]